MRDLMPLVEAWLAQGERVAVATVVRVLGSAPRPVGARMIVALAGRMAGSVSGGCVETAVYGELMEVLSGGAPRLLRFGITDDMIWDVGLACGGTIEVLVQELEPALADALTRELGEGRLAGLATVVAGPARGLPGRYAERSEASQTAQDETLRLHYPQGQADKPTGEEGPPDGFGLTVGETFLLGQGGLLFGSDDPAIVAALRLRLEGRQTAGAVQALDDGREVYLEAFLPPPALYILGGVHVAIPLARFAKELGFRVVVADPREKFANRERFPGADEVLVEWPDEALAHLPVGADSYIVLLTHDPKIDEPALAAALRTGAAYVGAIGSRKTHAERAARMAKWGVTAEELARVHAPIGLDLGGRTPEETALSIIAEVIAVKNARRGGPLQGSSGPIGSGGG